MHLMDIDASQRDFYGPREATSAYLGVIEFKILTVVPGLLHGLDDDFQCLFTDICRKFSEPDQRTSFLLENQKVLAQLITSVSPNGENGKTADGDGMVSRPYQVFRFQLIEGRAQKLQVVTMIRDESLKKPLVVKHVEIPALEPRAVLRAEPEHQYDRICPQQLFGAAK